MFFLHTHAHTIFDGFQAVIKAYKLHRYISKKLFIHSFHLNIFFLALRMLLLRKIMKEDVIQIGDEPFHKPPQPLLINHKP